MAIVIEVAPGELVDRITILEIKAERIGDAAKLQNVNHELGILVAARDQAFKTEGTIADLTSSLKVVNEKLWVVEDDIRDCERNKDFGQEFIALARSVYRLNDQRASLKKDINRVLNSAIIEEKSYAAY